jgi:uncharacterized protein
MRHALSVCAAAALAALVLPSAGVGQAPRRVVTIASGWVVGVYYPLAGAMSRIVYDAKDLNIRATVEASGASVANAQLIRAGDADFALIQNDIAFYAFNGSTLAAFRGKPVKNMGGVFTIYPELVHVVATRASGVKRIGDLRGKRVVLGPSGSGTEANAQQILEATGLKVADVQAVRIEAGAAAAELRADRVEAAFFTTGLGSAVIADIFESGHAVLVPVDEAEARALIGKYPFYTVARVPTDVYKDQGEASTVAVMAMLVARADLPPDLVYRFTRAIFDDLKQFHEAHPAARHLTLEGALTGMPIPLHRGAERFYRERNIGR